MCKVLILKANILAFQINTCNGFYCDRFTPNSKNKPSMWTENWTGWFLAFGGVVPYRPVEDIDDKHRPYASLGVSVRPINYLCHISEYRDINCGSAVGADGDEDRITELIDSGWEKVAAERKKLAAERKKLAVATAAKTQKREKVEEKEESDDDMGISLFD
ncbi:hypothetical protein CTI12_AA123890 [Artemisia annua]|uniref:beta-galactosidase n=1 Tax=Artemisia annua TaxID=35608 RepID=A0A2U1PQH6_ARTAN|nr:hypothetical protein CTI12_AA123890 [Artemisia annua]